MLQLRSFPKVVNINSDWNTDRATLAVSTYPTPIRPDGYFVASKKDQKTPAFKKYEDGVFLSFLYHFCSSDTFDLASFPSFVTVLLRLLLIKDLAKCARNRVESFGKSLMDELLGPRLANAPLYFVGTDIHGMSVQ